jgi:hypothetical protein
MRAVDAISHDEAARILGCLARTVARHIAAGRLRSTGSHPSLSLADVERLACQVYPWRRRVTDPDSYWVTATRAAALLGIGRSRLDQLANADRLPYVEHVDGTRLYRREQLGTIGNARPT